MRILMNAIVIYKRWLKKNLGINVNDVYFVIYIYSICGDNHGITNKPQFLFYGSRVSLLNEMFDEFYIYN